VISAENDMRYALFLFSQIFPSFEHIYARFGARRAERDYGIQGARGQDLADTVNETGPKLQVSSFPDSRNAKESFVRIL
jgi:hypothetical protein